MLAACGPSLRPGATVPASDPTDPITATPSRPAENTPAAGDELVIWLPPEFDPARPGPASELLQERVVAFEADHPGLRVRLRIKEQSGPGGLMETLSAASSIAPDALPDVIALHPAALTAAALKGLIQPLDGILERPPEETWFPYARMAAEIDGGYYGFPFASDAQVFAYRTGVHSSPPLSWARLLEADQPFLFPAGDPGALYTLVQYSAMGGTLAGPSGRPALDPSTLTRVLAFYASAHSSGMLPEEAARYSTAEQTWQQLMQGRVAAAAAPLSSFLDAQDTAFITASPLPSQNGTGVSVAYTWSWAVVTADPYQQQLAAEWIQGVSEPEFLGPWTEAHGLLPPSSAALDRWQEDSGAAAVALLAPTLQPRPSEEDLATFGPHLKDAVLMVLSGGATPDEAALQAAQAIQTP